MYLRDTTLEARHLRQVCNFRWPDLCSFPWPLTAPDVDEVFAYASTHRERRIQAGLITASRLQAPTHRRGNGLQARHQSVELVERERLIPI